MNRTCSKVLISLAACFFSLSAEAGPVTLPLNTWITEPFTLMNPGNTFPDAYTATVTGNLLVTGYYVTGDYYGIYVNGVLAQTTIQVSPINVDYGDQSPALYADPAFAYASGLFSTGRVSIKPGDVITISNLYPPSGIGEVAVQQVTPEPASVALFGLGILAAYALRKLRLTI